MKFIRSLFFLAGLVFLVFKIFENASYESRKELEKITIDFDPKSKKSPKVTRQTTAVSSDEEVEEEESDQLLDELVDANKAARKEKIEELSEKLHAGENILTSRQMKIIDILKAKGKIDTTMLQAVIPKVTIRTLRRDLDSLGKMGIIKKQGTTKGSYYVRV